MVTFEQPGAWIWIVLVLPLFLFALFRRKVRRVQVSSLFLWKEDFHSRRIRLGSRLSAWLSLLLQILVVVCFLAAWSGPRWGGVGKSGEQTPSRLVLVIDNSPSMGAREDPSGSRRLDRALKRARDWARWAREGRTVTVVTTSPEMRVRFREGETAREVRSGLKGITVSNFPGEDPRDVARWVQKMAGRTPTRVVVLTDRAVSLDQAGSGLEWVEWEQLGQPIPNDGILTVRSVRNVRGPGGVLVLDLVCDGGRAREKTIVIREGRKIRYQETLNLVPGSEVIRHQVKMDDLGSGALEIVLDPEDALSVDDRFQVKIPAPLPIPVVVVGGTQEKATAVDAALFALGDRVDRKESVRLDSGSLPSMSRQKRCLVVVQEGGTLGVWEKGVTLFLDPDLLCQRLGVEKEFVTSPRQSVRVQEEPAWSGWANLHDLIVRQHVNLSSWPGMNPIVSTRGGHPLVLAEKGPESLRVYLAFSLSQSNLAALAAFPLLLEGLLEQVAMMNPDRVAYARSPEDSRLDPGGEVTSGGPVERPGKIGVDLEFDLRPLCLALAVFFLIAEWGFDLVKRGRRGNR